MFTQDARVLVKEGDREITGVYVRKQNANSSIVLINNSEKIISNELIRPLPTLSQEEFKKLQQEKLNSLEKSSNKHKFTPIDQLPIAKKNPKYVLDEVKSFLNASENTSTKTDYNLSILVNNIDKLIESYKDIQGINQSLNNLKKYILVFKDENIKSFHYENSEITVFKHLGFAIIKNILDDSESKIPLELLTVLNSIE